MICCERDNKLGAGLSALVEPAPDTGCRKMGVLHTGNIFPWNLRSRWPGLSGLSVSWRRLPHRRETLPAPATVYRYIDRPGERPDRGSSSTSRCVMSPKMPKSRTVPSCLRMKQRCVWNIRCNCFTTAWTLFSSAQSLVMAHHAGFIIQHAFALA